MTRTTVQESRAGQDHDQIRQILLVEDDPDRARLTRHAVETNERDCKVTVASDGTNALKHLQEGKAPEGFDLVLLDLDLPDLSGHEVCKRIRSKHASHLPVVVLSSSDENQDIQRSYEAGANGYVTKAVDFQAFREDLDALLGYWLEVNDSPSTDT